MLLDKIIQSAHEKNASDIFFNINSPPFIRHNSGKIVPLMVPPLEENDMQEFMKYLMHEEQQKTYSENGGIEFSSQFGRARFRINIFDSNFGASISLHKVYNELKTIEDLNIPDSVLSLLDMEKGLIILSGPKGAYKRATCTTLLHYINETKDKYVITVEDAIDYCHKNNKSIIRQLEVGEHIPSHSDAITLAIREKADVIYINNMNSSDVIKNILRASESSNLIIATMDSMSCENTIYKILDSFQAHEKNLAASILSQNLISIISLAKYHRLDAVGHAVGYSQLMATATIKKLIHDQNIPSITAAIAQSGNKNGYTTEESIKALVKKKIISEDYLKSKIEMHNKDNIQNTRKDDF